ncbi:MAG: hypothetical protein QM686_11875 [Herbaspirillum sp.]
MQKAGKEVRDEQRCSRSKAAVCPLARRLSTKKNTIANAKNDLSRSSATPELSAANQAKDRCPWDLDEF